MARLWLCLLVVFAGAHVVVSGKTSMVWLSAGLTETTREAYAKFVDYLKGHRDAINAVSVEGLYALQANGTLTSNSTLLDFHRMWKPAGFKTFPIIGSASLDVIRRVSADHTQMIAKMVQDAHTYGFDGYNIDFEPHTDVLNASSPVNPTDVDAANFAHLLTDLADAMHNVGLTLTVDTMSVVGACRSAYHYPKNLQPCPWIRRFWNFQMLAGSSLDKVLTMDTYTQNNTEFPLDMLYNQWFMPTTRLGIGLCPWCWGSRGITGKPPTKEDLQMRFDLIKLYGIAELDFWELGNDPEIQAAWEIWWPFVVDWMKTPINASHSTLGDRVAARVI